MAEAEEAEEAEVREGGRKAAAGVERRPRRPHGGRGAG